MVKVQKQHEAGSRSSHLPQIPLFRLVRLYQEGKHPFSVSEMGFHSAAMAVPSSGPLFCPSLSFFSSPPFAATSGTQLLIYLCGLCCFFLFLFFLI